MTTNTHIDTEPTPVAAEVDTAKSDPTSDTDAEAMKVLAKARYEAFRLVTDARDEADEILEEARKSAESIIRTAEITAESITDAARMQAKDIIAGGTHTDDHREPSAPQSPELSIRMEELREIAEKLDAQFSALTKTPAAPPAADVDPAYGPSQAPVLDYSPSVAAPAPADNDGEPDEDPFVDPVEDTRRGSFYSRRSAKLPSIGDAGGKGALDMMRSIRESLDDSP